MSEICSNCGTNEGVGCKEHSLDEPSASLSKRKQGHSALRWNKDKRKMEKFDPNPELAAINKELNDLPWEPPLSKDQPAQPDKWCQCACHEDGEPWCAECFDANHVAPVALSAVSLEPGDCPCEKFTGANPVGSPAEPRREDVINMPTYEEIEGCLKTYLPYFQSDDKDQFLYIVKEDDLMQTALKIWYLIYDRAEARTQSVNLEQLVSDCGGRVTDIPTALHTQSAGLQACCDESSMPHEKDRHSCRNPRILPASEAPPTEKHWEGRNNE